LIKQVYKARRRDSITSATPARAAKIVGVPTPASGSAEDVAVFVGSGVGVLVGVGVAVIDGVGVPVVVAVVGMGVAVGVGVAVGDGEADRDGVADGVAVNAGSS
jgi:hypothetical protein